MSVKIDNFALSFRAEDGISGIVSEIRNVKKIGVAEKRRIMEGRAVSHDGDTIADMGRSALRIVIEGELHGQDAPSSAAELIRKFYLGKPVELVSELSLLREIRKVVIEELRISRLADTHNLHEYTLILREYNG